MKIAVWSPTPFAGRKSTHLLLLVLMTIMVEKSEQLVIHTDSEGSGAEHFLLSGNHRNRMMEQKEFGVEFLCRSLHCERFSKELAINSSYTFAEGKLHVLPGGSRRFYEERDATAEVCDMILTHYDAAFHIQCEKQESFEEGEKQGIQTGLQTGISRGISAMISDNLEEHISMERILLKLQKHFQLTPEEAQEWVNNCVNTSEMN